MNVSPTSGVVCPTCFAENRPGAKVCFLCDGAIELPVDKQQPVVTSPARLPVGSFRIGSLMLVIALIAVCLGVSMEQPAFGATLSIFSAIAVVRTFVLVSRSEREGRPVSGASTVVLFLMTLFGTVLVTFAVAIASFAAFFATCLGIANARGNENGMLPAILVGLIVGLGLLYGLIVLFRRMGLSKKVINYFSRRAK